MYYYKKFNTNKLFDFVKKLELKYVSDWIIGVTSTKRIVNMTALLKKIESEENIDNIIFSKEMFIDKIKLKEVLSQNIYSQTYCKYVLLKLEYLETEQVNEKIYTTISVEHVLPQNINPNSKWLQSFTNDQHDYWKDKLANLILLSKRKNSAASNYDFENKKQKYFSDPVT